MKKISEFLKEWYSTVIIIILVVILDTFSIACGISMWRVNEMENKAFEEHKRQFQEWKDESDARQQKLDEIEEKLERLKNDILEYEKSQGIL